MANAPYGNTPLLILVFLQKTEYIKKESSVIPSVAASIQNMLLMAYTKGWGSCWLTALLEADADEILKERYAPDRGKMLAFSTFGYPVQEPGAPRRKPDRYKIV